MSCRLLAALLALGVSTASAQDLRFTAVVQPDGSVRLEPVPPSSSPKPQPSPVEAEDYAAAKMGMGELLGGAKDMFLQKDPNGVVAGVFLFPEGNVPGELFEGLKPGSSITRVDGSSYVASWGSPGADAMKQMQATAEAAAQQLFSAARNTACSFDPLPTTISPSVEVSFTLFAGGSFSVSAEWETAKICPPPTPTAAP